MQSLKLKLSYALNVLLGIVVIYLLATKITCPEVNETVKSEKTIIAAPDSTEHTHVATLTTPKRSGKSKSRSALWPMENKSTFIGAASAGDSACMVADSLSFSVRDSNIFIEAAGIGHLAPNPTIKYKLLRPSRIDHYIETKEYVSSESFMRLYVGAQAMEVNSDYRIGASASAAFNRFELEYTYWGKSASMGAHSFGIKGRLFGK